MIQIDRNKFHRAVLDFGQSRLAGILECNQSNIANLFSVYPDLERMTFKRFNEMCSAMKVDARGFIIDK